jgi:hypothetical protein
MTEGIKDEVVVITGASSSLMPQSLLARLKIDEWTA